MKKRLLTALIGVAVAVAWMFTINTPVFAVVMGIVAAMASYEMLKVFNVKNIPFRILNIAVALAIPILFNFRDKLGDIGIYPAHFFTATTFVIICALVIMVLDFEKLRFEQVVCSLFASSMVSAALGTVVLLKDVSKDFGSFTKNDGLFFILFAFFCSWVTDGCAYFAGRALGKHKLCVKISPNKTVEGAIGGVIGNTLICIALYYIFVKKFLLSANITPAFVIISSVILSVVSMFGDLAASTIKRHHGIKDFGNLLPGHGGVMDRFDSSVFVFPLLYAIIKIVY